MSTDYTCNGIAKLKRCPAVIEIIEHMRSKVLDHESVTFHEPKDFVIELEVSFGGDVAISTPQSVRDDLEKLEPFLLEPTSFTMSEGCDDDYDVWYGKPDEVERAQSHEALSKIGDLLPTLKEEELAHLRAFCDLNIIATPDRVSIWLKKALR